MDTVFIRDFRVRGKHGVAEHERQNEQDFIFDIEASCDTKKAAASDELSDTVDYIRFVDIIRQKVSEHSFYLIERLGQTIADEILTDARISHLRITVRKPSVLESGEAGITIERKQV